MAMVKKTKTSSQKSAKGQKVLFFYSPVAYSNPDASLTAEEKSKLHKALSNFKAEQRLSFDEEPVLNFLLNASHQLKAGEILFRSNQLREAREQLTAISQKTKKFAVAVTREMEAIQQLVRSPALNNLVAGRLNRESLRLEGKTAEELIGILSKFAQDLETVAAYTKGKSGPAAIGILFQSHLVKLGSLFRYLTKTEPTATETRPFVGFATQCTSSIVPFSEDSAKKYITRIRKEAQESDDEQIKQSCGFPDLTEKDGCLVFPFLDPQKELRPVQMFLPGFYPSFF